MQSWVLSTYCYPAPSMQGVIEAYNMSRSTRGRWRRSYMLARQIQTSQQNYEGIPGTVKLVSSTIIEIKYHVAACDAIT